MRERQSYLVTARLPLGLIASRTRQVSEHTFLMGHAHTQSSAHIFFKNRKKPQEIKIRQEGGTWEKRQETQLREKEKQSVWNIRRHGNHPSLVNYSILVNLLSYVPLLEGINIISLRFTPFSSLIMSQKGGNCINWQRSIGQSDRVRECEILTMRSHICSRVLMDRDFCI